MPELSQQDLLFLLLRLPVILLALVIHEVAHAWTADRLGDPTARRQGRITFNPLAHLDPLGTICLLFAPIGWAKPVPVNPLNFRNPGRDDILVSAAGPVSNLLQAAIYALLLRFNWDMWLFTKYAGPVEADAFAHTQHMHTLVLGLWYMLTIGVYINVGLFVFNLLPFFPLDGHHIARENLHGEARSKFIEFQRYGPIAIVALIVIDRTTPVHPISGPIHWLGNLLVTYLSGGPRHVLPM